MSMADFTAHIFYDASIRFSLGYRIENCITATYTALEHNTGHCTLQAEIHMGFLPCAGHYIQGQHNYCERNTLCALHAVHVLRYNGSGEGFPWQQ